MKNLFEVVRNRTNEFKNESSQKFNTNDYLLELLLDKKIKRVDVIDHIITKRIELSGVDLKAMDQNDLNEMIDKLYKTSKNGLDTSVSDSNNNSSFSYNDRFKDYVLIKDGPYLEIKKIDQGKK